MSEVVIECPGDNVSKLGVKMYIYVKKTIVNGRPYYYLVIQEYDPRTGRKRNLLHLSIKKILEAFKDELGNGKEFPWCGGWDLNPRRPTPSGPEPDPRRVLGNNGGVLVNRQVDGFLKQRLGIKLSQKLEQGFLNWCKKHSSEETCKQYLKKLEEIDLRIKEIDSSRWHTTAYKRLTRFLCEEHEIEKACKEFRRVKSKKSGQDIYIPSDTDVRAALRAPEPLGSVYWVLVQSGIRAREAIYLLNNIDRIYCEEKEEFTRCQLAWKRGTKNVLWAYLLEKPEQRTIDYKEVIDARAALGTVAFKYIRKWVSMKMKLLEIDDAAVNFIQGRVPESVLRKHYLDRLILADKFYPRYAEWLRSWLGGRRG